MTTQNADSHGYRGDGQYLEVFFISWSWTRKKENEMLKLLCLTRLLSEFKIRSCEDLALEKEIAWKSSERYAKSVGNKR